MPCPRDRFLGFPTEIGRRGRSGSARRLRRSASRPPWSSDPTTAITRRQDRHAFQLRDRVSDSGSWEGRAPQALLQIPCACMGDQDAEDPAGPATSVDPEIGSPRPAAGTYGPGRSAHRSGQPGSTPAGFLLCPVLHGGTGHLDRTPDLCLRARRHCRRSHHRPGSVGAVHRARSFPRRRGRRTRSAARSCHRHGRAGRQHGSGRRRNGMGCTGVGRPHVGADDRVEHHPHPPDTSSAVPRRRPYARGAHGGQRHEWVDVRRRLPRRAGAGRRTGCVGWDGAGRRWLCSPRRPGRDPRGPVARSAGPRAVLRRTGERTPLGMASARRVPSGTAGQSQFGRHHPRRPPTPEPSRLLLRACRDDRPALRDHRGVLPPPGRRRRRLPQRRHRWRGGRRRIRDGLPHRPTAAQRPPGAHLGRGGHRSRADQRYSPCGAGGRTPRVSRVFRGDLRRDQPDPSAAVNAPVRRREPVLDP